MYGQLYIKNSVETKPPKQMPKSWKDGGNIEKKNTLGFHGFNIFLRFQLKKDMDVLFPSVGWLIEGFEQTPLTTGKWL